MDGRSLRDKRSPLWPHALSVHRPIFYWHGHSGEHSHCRLLPLGSRPWLVLAILIAGGNALWWGSERVFGTYSGPGQDFLKK